MKKILSLLLIVTIILTGCVRTDNKRLEAEPEDVITDSYGNVFYLPMEVDRAIVLSSSVYEMICALDKEDVVIGVSDNIDYPASALEKEKFGDFKKPNVELLLEAQPDVVFGSGTRLDADIVNQLRDAGIPVVMLNLSDPETILDEVIFLGKMLDAEAMAEAFCADVQKLLELVAERTRDVQPIKVYWEIYTDYKTVGKDSPGDHLLRLSGVSNIAGQEPTAYPQISDEWLLEADPDMIVKLIPATKGIMGPFVDDPAGAQAVSEEIQGRPGWEYVGAVRNGKVLILHGALSTTPLGMAITPLFIAKTAYPEQFFDIDPDEKLAWLLETYWDEPLTGIWSWQN